MFMCVYNNIYLYMRVCSLTHSLTSLRMRSFTNERKDFMDMVKCLGLKS